jgi:hypothetical protein
MTRSTPTPSTAIDRYKGNGHDSRVETATGRVLIALGAPRRRGPHRSTTTTAAKAANAFTIGASPLSQNEYKVDLLREILEESLVSMFA